MSGFRKAKAEQAALKISMYGPPGSGKTFTALLLAEGLAAIDGRRIACVDTERGTDFYCQPVPQRAAHPEAFDFDALYSRSLTEVVKAVKGLKATEHGVVVIDSITHLWDAAKASYTGPKTKIGGIPMHAWQKIKAPYKELMHWVINCPLHVMLLGRQGNEFTEDEETGETKATGVKMRAEGETAYEPHCCFRLEPIKGRGKGREKREIIPALFVEKDRTGILQGQVIEWPSFENVAKPLLGLLGKTQAQQQSEDDAAAQDSEALAAQERAKERASQETLQHFQARLTLARSEEAVKEVGKEITPDLKKGMQTAHVHALRDAYLEALQRVKQLEPASNGQHQ